MFSNEKEWIYNKEKSKWKRFYKARPNPDLDMKWIQIQKVTTEK